MINTIPIINIKNQDTNKIGAKLDKQETSNSGLEIKEEGFSKILGGKSSEINDKKVEDSKEINEKGIKTHIKQNELVKGNTVIGSLKDVLEGKEIEELKVLEMSSDLIRENVPVDFQEIVKILKNVADNLSEKKEIENIGELENKSVLVTVNELVSVINELQNLLGDRGQFTQMLDKISNDLENTNKSEQNNVIMVNIKELNYVVGELKNLIWNIREINSENQEIIPKTSQILSKIGQLEDEILKIQENKHLKIESKIIEIIKSDSINNKDKVNGKEVEENIMAINQNMRIKTENASGSTAIETKVDDTIKSDVSGSAAIETKVDDTIKSDVSEMKVDTMIENEIKEESNINKIEANNNNNNNILNNSVEKNIGAKIDKPLELNLEQLRKNVQDKFEQIQKMVVAKDKMLVQLNPKNLGAVELFFRKTEEGLELTVETEGKGTKQQIEMLFDELKRDFKERNIELNFIFREKHKDENSERKNESQHEERKLENEKEPEQTFREVMERVLRGE